MKRYYRLQDSRVHSNPNSSTATATATATPTSLNSTEMYRGGEGSCSGRLGAAVQRVMAMRERHSSQNDVKGIGAMRDLYISCPTTNCNKAISAKSECWKCERNGPQMAGKEVSVVGTQSMRYTRFLPSKDWCNASENEDGGHHSFASLLPGFVSNGTQSPQICVACICVNEDQKENTVGKKKGFLRYVRRQLLGLGRKSFTDV
ncbi:hypothetical protein SUGI_1194430 [Cryptomeria japonica]|nr:hypothetical protein SUGI_1194430 [Cryptomeria japonica]